MFFFFCVLFVLYPPLHILSSFSLVLFSSRARSSWRRGREAHNQRRFFFLSAMQASHIFFSLFSAFSVYRNFSPSFQSRVYIGFFQDATLAFFFYCLFSWTPFYALVICLCGWYFSVLFYFPATWMSRKSSTVFFFFLQRGTKNKAWRKKSNTNRTSTPAAASVHACASCASLYARHCDADF